MAQLSRDELVSRHKIACVDAMNWTVRRCFPQTFPVGDAPERLSEDTALNAKSCYVRWGLKREEYVMSCDAEASLCGPRDTFCEIGLKLSSPTTDR